MNDAAQLPAGDTRRVRAVRLALPVAILSIVGWAVLVCQTRTWFVGDEIYHVPAIRDLADGHWETALGLPLPPTYHLYASCFVRVLGDALWVMRLANVVLAVAAVLLYHAAARACHRDYGAARLLQFAWNPLLLPYWVLVYTDLAALVAVLVALNFHVRNRTKLAAVGLLLACVIRQTSVMWVLLFLALGALRHYDARRAADPADETDWPALARDVARRYWPYGLAFAAGSAFAIAGRGALFAAKIENWATVNVAQIFVLVLLAALLWLPRWIAHVPHVWRRHIEPALVRPSGSAAAVAATALLAETYGTHYWNRTLDFLRNWPLLYMARQGMFRYLMAALVVFLLPVFAYVTWRNPARRVLILLWAFTILFVMPHYVADPRYYIVPFVLIDFYTREQPARLRWQVAWYLLLAVGVGAFIVTTPGGYRGVW